MKKILSLLLLLTMSLSMHAYVSVNGTNIHGTAKTYAKNELPGLSAGTISVNPTSHLIIMKDVTLNSTGSNETFRISSESDYWRIIIQGECYISNSHTTQPVYLSNNKQTIFIYGMNADGSDKLRISNMVNCEKGHYNGQAIRSFGSSFILKNLNIEITSSNSTPINMSGTYTNSLGQTVGSSLTLRGVDGKISCYSTQQPIEFREDAGDLMLEGCKINTSADIAWNSTTKTLEKNGAAVKGAINFEVLDFDLQVGGVAVTGHNMYEIGGNTSVRYEVRSDGIGVLSMYNATIDGKIRFGTSHTEPHVVYVYGTTTINGGAKGGITNMGTGKMSIIGMNSGCTDELQINTTATSGMDGIWNNEADLAIENINLDIQTPDHYGINARASASSTLTINKANVKVSCSESAIRGFASLVMDDEYFYQTYSSFSRSKGLPFYDTTGKNVLCGSDISKTADIRYGYGIMLDGKNVTPDNKDDVLSDGSASYNPATHTLKLQSASITASSGFALATYCSDDLTILCDGTNTLKSNSNTILTFGDGLTTFAGADPDATLNVSTTATGQIAMTAFRSDLIIKDLNLNIEALDKGYAIWALKGLVVDNARVEANSEEEAIEAHPLTLKDCVLLIPDGGAWDEGSGVIKDSEGKKATSVLINNKYGVTIAGEPVTIKNHADILGDGTVSFDPETSTLTLKDANFESGVESCITAEMPLIINLEGDNKLTAYGSSCIYNCYVPASAGEPATTIVSTNNGTLTIDAGTVGVYADRGGILIKDCALTINKSTYGIAGYGGIANEQCVIDNAEITIKHSDYGHIMDFESITLLNNATIVTPEGAHVGTYKGNAAVVDASDQVIKGDTKLHILPVVEYNVTVKGQKLNTLTCADPLGNGTVSYDPATKTLTLDNANITYNSGAALLVAFDDYVLDLKGNNIVNGSDYAIGVGLGTLTISSTCDGTLSCSSSDVASATLAAAIGIINIKDCSVELYNNNGTALSAGGVGRLNIDHANVKAFGRGGCITDWLEVTLNDCYIDQPTGAVIGGAEETKDAGIYLDGAPVMNQFVEIKQGTDVITYDIKIAGIDVTNKNAADVLGDGSVSYDADSKTLTLLDANITATDKTGIYLGIPTTVVLAGSNKIDVTGSSSAMYLDACKVTITGAGVLTATSEADGIHVSDHAGITFDNTTVSVDAQGYGIGRHATDTSSSLTIKYSSVKAKGLTAAIAGFGNPTLEKSWIKTEDCGYFGLMFGYVDEFNNYVTEMEILPKADGIDGITTGSNAPAYNLAGQRVRDGYKGVVVKGGKKAVNK